MPIAPMPWIIEQEDAERIRRKEDRRRRTRLEIPHSDEFDSEYPDNGGQSAEAAATGVEVMDISPPDENAIDL